MRILIINGPNLDILGKREMPVVRANAVDHVLFTRNERDLREHRIRIEKDFARNRQVLGP